MNFIKEKLTEREEQSVIAHLLRYDEMIKKLFDEIRNAQGVSSEVQMFSDDINDKIKDAFENIRKEMTNKLQNILFFIEEKKNSITNDAFKFRNEISILTKENEDLSKEILALKEQIKKMENLIGQNDYKQMSFTK